MTTNTKEYIIAVTVCLVGAVVIGLIARDADVGAVAFPIFLLCAILSVAIDIRSRLDEAEDEPASKEDPNGQH